MTLINSSTNKIIHEKIDVASSFFERCKGLIGETNISRGLIIPTSLGIHTFLMHEPIDVIVVDKNKYVKEVKTDLYPNRAFLLPWASAYVIELPRKTCTKIDISIGDSILWM